MKLNGLTSASARTYPYVRALKIQNSRSLNSGWPVSTVGISQGEIQMWRANLQACLLSEFWISISNFHHRNSEFQQPTTVEIRNFNSREWISHVDIHNFRRRNYGFPLVFFRMKLNGLTIASARTNDPVRAYMPLRTRPQNSEFPALS